jgi:superfamily II DNA/RNA helicase
MLTEQKALDRIVIDEAHMYLSSAAAFRPTIRDMRHVFAFGVQVVLLTATLPPSRQDKLIRFFGLAREQPAILRAPTTRSNIAYKIFPRRKPGVPLHGSEFSRQHQAALDRHISLQVSGKVLIMSKSRRRAESIAEELKCDFYHSNLTEIEKRRVTANFSKGTIRHLSATNGFGTGMDIADIRLVFHDGPSSTLLDYVQESGRAGRDGHPCEACIVYDPNFKSSTTTSGSIDSFMIEFLTTSICRRIILEKDLDGLECVFACKGGKEALCDLCKHRRAPQPDQTLTPVTTPLRLTPKRVAHFDKEDDFQRSIKRTRRHDVKMHATQEQWYTHFVDFASTTCTFCSQDPTKENNHSTTSCTVHPHARTANELVMQIKFDSYAACFKCHHPQWICNSYQTKKECPYQKTILYKTALAVYDQSELETMKEQDNKASQRKRATLRDWLGKLTRLHAGPEKRQMSMLHRVFMSAMEKLRDEYRIDMR